MRSSFNTSPTTIDRILNFSTAGFGWKPFDRCRGAYRTVKDGREL
jgi:hypothetical protein